MTRRLLGKKISMRAARGASSAVIALAFVAVGSAMTAGTKGGSVDRSHRAALKERRQVTSMEREGLVANSYKIAISGP